VPWSSRPRSTPSNPIDGSRHLDRQGQPTQDVAHLADPREFAGCRWRGAGCHRSLDEQCYRVAADVDRQAVRAKYPLEWQDQPHPAGHEDGQVGTRRQQPLDQHGDGVHQVLAIVEDEKHATPAQGGDCRLDRTQPTGGQRPARVRDGLLKPDRVGHGHQIDPLRVSPLDRRECEARLSHPAGAHRAHQPRGVEGGPQLSEFAGPTDEGGQRGRRGRNGRRPALLDRVPHQRAMVRHRELAPKRCHMAFHRPHRDEQPLPDLLVREVLSEQQQHLAFARCHALRVHPASVPP